MLFTRPRQPAAGRRPPQGPEHAETGRPLPRVTATDDSVPERHPIPAGRHRPPLARLRRCPPAADRLRRTTVLASTHRRLPCAARGPSREAQTCAATPARPPDPSRRRTNRSFRYPRRDALVPGSLTGPALAIGARTAAGRNARGDRSAVRPLPARDAGRRRPARGTACRWTEPVVHHPPADGRAPPEAPEGARPGQRDPVPWGNRGPEC